MLFLRVKISLVITFSLLWCSSLPLFSDEGIRSDASLQSKVSLDFKDQTVETVVQALASAAKARLTVDAAYKDLRLSLRFQQMPCSQAMEVIAATLRLRWEKKGQGWHLTRSQEEQEKMARMHQIYLASLAESQRILALHAEKRKEIQTFAESLFYLKPMSDAEVLEYAKSFPAAEELLKKDPKAVLIARLVTHLDSAKLAQVFEKGGIRLTREEVLRTGSDLGLDFDWLLVQKQDYDGTLGGLLVSQQGSRLRLTSVSFR